MIPHRRRQSNQFRAPLVASSELRLRESGTSGELSIGYVRLRSVLVRHLSSILVDAVLKRALDARGTSPMLLHPSDLPELTSDIMIGLRLFVPADELPELMLELAEFIDQQAP